MAAGWLTALKLVPWSDVISLAPKVLDGAKSLRDAVSRRSSTSGAVPTDAVAGAPEAVAERLQTLSVATAALQAQMGETTELLRTLADQNAQLVAQMARAQRRARWLVALTVASVAMAAVALWRVGV